MSRDYAKGGLVKGPSNAQDSIAVMLSPGQYEISAEALRRYGPELLARLNGSTVKAREPSDEG